MSSFQEYSFTLDRQIVLDDIRCRGIGKREGIKQQNIEKRKQKTDKPKPITITKTYFKTKNGVENLETPVFESEIKSWRYN